MKQTLCEFSLSHTQLKFAIYGVNKPLVSLNMHLPPFRICPVMKLLLTQFYISIAMEISF